MSDADKIQILTAALQRIAKWEDSPDIDPSGDIQLGLHCGVEDRYIDSVYDAADFGYTKGAEVALEWATNEASFALKQILDSGGAENEWPCFECDDGTIRLVRKPYETTGGKGEPLTIPDVPIWTCDTCGDQSFDKNGSQIIQEAREAAGVKYRR
jgi:YgiT-type zinc finger domain-containing protein